MEPDRSLDRRRLKRRLVAWRVLAILALVALVIVGLGRIQGPGPRHYVARLWVDGLILDDPDRDAALQAVADDRRAAALIVRIDSPGGTVVGGEALYRALRRVARVKPVVAVMGTEAASAAYMAALGADRIVAHEGTITGSIGVILQTAEITRLLTRLGVSTEAIKSSPLKAVPSPLEKLTDEGRRAARAIVEDMYGLFVDLVAERRGLPREQVLKLADGRIFTGRQARARGLVDALGDEHEARAWLATARQVATSLPVRDVFPQPLESWLRALLGEAGKALSPERLVLDGLISVWHPALGP